MSASWITGTTSPSSSATASPTPIVGVGDDSRVGPRTIERGVIAKRARDRAYEEIGDRDVSAGPLAGAPLPAEHAARDDLALDGEVRDRGPARQCPLGHRAPRAADHRDPRVVDPRARAARPSRSRRRRRGRRLPGPGGRGRTRGRRDRRPPRAPSAARAAMRGPGAAACSAACVRASPGARIRAITLPTGASSPACALTATSVPSAGASSSTVTLSVSISIRGSPLRTGSPSP